MLQFPTIAFHLFLPSFFFLSSFISLKLVKLLPGLPPHEFLIAMHTWSGYIPDGHYSLLKTPLHNSSECSTVPDRPCCHASIGFSMELFIFEPYGFLKYLPRENYYCIEVFFRVSSFCSFAYLVPTPT